MEFKKIDRSNYWDCICLKISKEQEGFVADNARSLVEAAYEEGVFTRGIYQDGKMVGFVLYDYDQEIPGWSMSRFMIGEQYQGRGYGKQGVREFLEYLKQETGAKQVFISVELENTRAREMYRKIGFRDVKEIQYEILGVTYREMRMVKEL